MRHARPPSLRYGAPRLAASIVGQLGRDVGLAESGLPRVKRDALLTPRALPGQPGREQSLELSLTTEDRFLSLS
jgi:hypothetical protein